jgi:hypothetical protein
MSIEIEDFEEVEDYSIVKHLGKSLSDLKKTVSANERA